MKELLISNFKMNMLDSEIKEYIKVLDDRLQNLDVLKKGRFMFAVYFIIFG